MCSFKGMRLTIMIGDKFLSRRKTLLIIGLFFTILTIFRIGWMVYCKTPDHPLAQKGVIDFSDWAFTDDQTITLDGEWEFYPNEFIDPHNTVEHTTPHQYISVPGSWAKSINADGDKPVYGHGTYRVKILLPGEEDSLYGIRMKEVTSAARVYIDGELVSTYGHPDVAKDQSKGEHGPFSVLFPTNNREIELMIHVSNYDVSMRGGITKSINIGTSDAIIKDDRQSLTLQMAVFVVYIIHSIYAFILYFMARGFYQRELLFYGFMLVIAGFVVLIDDDIVLHLPINVIAYQKLLSFLFISTLMTLVTSIKYLFQIKSRLFSTIVTLYTVVSIIILVIPNDYYMYSGIGAMFLYLLSFYFLFSQTVKIIQRGNKEGIYVLLFITGYTSNMIWGSLINMGLVDIPYYPFDFIIYVFAIALLLLNRHMEVIRLNQQQTKELQIADQKKDEFLANTSHELRNPLHGIINIAQSTLSDESQLSPTHKENLKLLIQIGQRMNFTLNDLLDITRLEEKTLVLKRENVNLQTVISGIIDMLQFMTEGKDITFFINIPNDFPFVYADQNRLIQILFNLMHNAVKFTNKGSITIEATRKNDTATIAIIDTGSGMSEEEVQTIFEPYHRGSNHIHSNNGIGLGLHITKQFIDLHGGDLFVESKAGKGSIFSFTLPVSMENRLQAESEISATVTHSKEIIPLKEMLLQDEPSDNIKANILVVDDDPVNVKVLQNILSSTYNVCTAFSGQEALTHIHSQTFDLVISDVMMPHMSGYTLTQTIREHYSMSELPVLLLTARQQLEDVYTGFTCGANDYVSKPVDALELKARVHALTTLRTSVNEQLRFEAAWLQAQIKPHFLFNTLNTIASLGEIDTNRMINLIDEFGNYLRKSFDVYNTNHLIPISHELDLTKSYLFIEKERFGDRLEIDWNIEHVEDLKVPPLSVQTLVENAVNHGVLKHVHGGRVSINIIEHDTYFEIAICDDGVGMSDEKVQQILSDDPDTSEGVGVTNTNRRLKKLFRKGLSITSQPGQGTTVSFHIPKEAS